MSIFICQLCENEFSDLEVCDLEDIENIRENGRCLDCWEEWNDQYPDRV